MKKQFLILISSILFANYNAQVGIGTTTPNSSAILDVNSINKGFLLPRLNLSGKNDNATIISPANGLMVFNLTSSGAGTNAVSANSLYFRQNSLWQKFTNVTEVGVFTFSNQFVLKSVHQQTFNQTQLSNVNSSETADIPIVWAEEDIFLDNSDDVQRDGAQRFKINTAGQYRILANFTFSPRRNVTANNSNFTTVAFTIMKSQDDGKTWTAVFGTVLPFDNGITNEVQTVIMPRVILNFAADDLIQIVMNKPGGTSTPNYSKGSGIVSKATDDITKVIRIRRIN